MTKELESITTTASIHPLIARRSRAVGIGSASASLVSVLLLSAACNSQSSTTPGASASSKALASAAPSASSVPVAKLAGGVPISPTVVEKVVNPKREAAYAGPVGSVAGSVSIVGDEVPLDSERTSIPADCLAARETYKHPIREGIMRSAADVFVAVTEYEGYLPAREDAMVVAASGCAFDTRTIGLTFGQALDIVSKDRRPYVPELLGSRATAQLVVTPGGDPVRLYPERPGRYTLVDSMRIFATADVFVVAYRTFDVTGLDGKFEIKDIPVGKVKLNALLPAANLTTQREITIEPGKTTTVDLELKFDKKAFAQLQQEKAKDSPAAKPSSSVAPKGSN